MARILVIDDDRSTRRMLKYILEKYGHEIEEAANGNEGIKLYSEKPVDIVITDIFMPNKDGVDTILDLKLDFPDVKIIAISSDKSWLKTIKDDLNISKTLAKPLDLNEILETVRELLENIQIEKKVVLSP